MSKKQNTTVDPSNARDPKYKKAMAEILETTECPLCTLKWHPNPIIQDDGFWLLTKSGYPYEDTQHHLLLIAKRHVEELEGLTDEESLALLNMTQWAAKKFNIVGGGLTMRFGDTKYTGATIKHLHAHIIQPELGENNKGKVVNFPIG